MTDTPSLTLAAVRKFEPCEEGYKRVSAILPKRGKIDAAQAREAGCTFDDIVWIASAYARTDRGTERRLRHWLGDVAARVLHIYEQVHPNDSRPRDAIQAAHDYAEGRIGDAALTAALDAARAAAWDAAWDAALDAALDAARAAAWDAALDAEEAWQFDRLIYWLTEPDPQPLEMPAKQQVAV